VLLPDEALETTPQYSNIHRPHLPEDHCGIDSSAGVDRGVAARAIEPPMD
jgi:hypothetical protein